MEVLQAVSKQLRLNAGVTALVGTKVYPYVAPAGVDGPYITVVKSSGRRWSTHEGGKTLVAPRISVVSWAASYDQAVSIANAVVTCLRDFSGSLGGGLTVQDVMFVDEHSLHDPSRMYGEVRDFNVMYQEVI